MRSCGRVEPVRSPSAALRDLPSKPAALAGAPSGPMQAARPPLVPRPDQGEPRSSPRAALGTRTTRDSRRSSRPWRRHGWRARRAASSPLPEVGRHVMTFPSCAQRRSWNRMRAASSRRPALQCERSAGPGSSARSLPREPAPARVSAPPCFQTRITGCSSRTIDFVCAGSAPTDSKTTIPFHPRSRPRPRHREPRAFRAEPRLDRPRRARGESARRGRARVETSQARGTASRHGSVSCFGIDLLLD